MTKFRHIPVAGRLIIVAVAIGVFAIAVVACATSYNAIYRLISQLGLYGYRINQAFPLMLDAAFLVAELAAILGPLGYGFYLLTADGPVRRERPEPHPDWMNYLFTTRPDRVASIEERLL